MSQRRGVGLALVLTLVIATLDVALVASRSSDVTPPQAAPAPSVSPRPPETLDEQLARVARVVQDIRGLEFPELPEATYLDSVELAARAATFADDYGVEQADLDRRIYQTLGALPAGYDLLGGLRDLLSEQVAGFYDPETGEMVVGVGEAGKRLSPLEELFLAHELEHALADATLGLPEDPDVPLGEDAALAAAALVEGDASLTMQRYVAVGLSTLDQLRVAGESLGTLDQLDVLEQVPWLLRRSLEFPYLEGLRFVTGLEARGGWAAVDRAYAQPPTSSAQILFPERYDAGVQPEPPPEPGVLSEPWTQRTRISFGAADLLFLFEAPGDDVEAALSDPRQRAAAWAGGALTLWTDPRVDADAVALVLVERDTSGALCDSMAAWYLRAFPDIGPAQRQPGEVLAADGPTQDAVVRCGDRTVRVGIAPDLATARAAAG